MVEEPEKRSRFAENFEVLNFKIQRMREKKVSIVKKKFSHRYARERMLAGPFKLRFLTKQKRVFISFHFFCTDCNFGVSD